MAKLNLGFALLVGIITSSCLSVPYDVDVVRDLSFVQAPVSSQAGLEFLFGLVGKTKEDVFDVFGDLLECGEISEDACVIRRDLPQDDCIYGCGFALAPNLKIGVLFVFKGGVLEYVSTPVDNSYIVNSMLLSFERQGEEVELYRFGLQRSGIKEWGRWYFPTESKYMELIQEPSNLYSVFFAISLHEINLARTTELFDSCQKELCMRSAGFLDNGYCTEHCFVNRISEDFVWGVDDDVCRDVR